MKLSLAVRCALCLAPAVLAGCYSYTYAPTTPAPGLRMSLELNDEGRYRMSGHIGPDIVKIEGWLVTAVDSEYTLRVERTVNIRGGSVPWSGEQVVVLKSYVGIAREKRFSAPKTFMLAGAVTAGFVGFIASRGLSGFGFGSGDTSPGNPNGN